MNGMVGLEEISNYIIKIRREIHQYPEIEFDLKRTCDLVKRELYSMGLEPIEKYGLSSIITVVEGKKLGNTVAFRADMDALKVGEKNDVDYRSKNSGMMHACGHDGHTAMLLGVAKILSNNTDKISGRFKLIFQASEEGPSSGAKLMVEDGVMDDVDNIIAFHLTNEFPLGVVKGNKGAAMAAASRFNIKITGRGGHAAEPHKSIDAIALAVRVFTEIQYLKSRETDPGEPLLISVGTINGGSSSNIIAENIEMTGTIRSYSLELNESIKEKMKKILERNVVGNGGRYEYKVNDGLPPLINEIEIVNRAKKSFDKVLDKETILIDKGKMGSEDFVYYLKDKPGAMFWLGARSDSKGKVYHLHNPRFNFDENALFLGVKCFVQYALDQKTTEDE